MSLLEPTKGARPIIHLIDTCLRWSATQDSGGKTESILLEGISAIWISIHGPMKVLTLDQESSMRGKGVDDWAIANGITLHYKAPRQKAWLVERHNEILRQSLHRVETQMMKESLVCTFKTVLAIVTFMHNSLIGSQDSTPHNCVVWATARMLPPFEGGYIREGDRDCNVHRVYSTGVSD